MNKPNSINSADIVSPMKSRHDILDALRGFALFGICIANVPVFAGWILVGADDKANIAGAGLYDALLLLFVDGRFYTIFSFLFGIGFSLQLSRLKLKDSSRASSLYLRRLIILLIIGLVHNFVFWIGDILVLYAVLGFVLFFMRDSTDKTLLTLAAVMVLLPIPGYLLFWLLGIDPDVGFYEIAGQLVNGEPDIASFFGGLYETINTPMIARYFELNLEIGIARVGYYIDTWRIPKVFGVMLVGMWAGRQLVAGKLLENTRLLTLTMVVGLVVGLPASLVYMSLSGLNTFQPYSREGFWSVLAYIFAVFPLGFAYAAVFALLWRKKTSVLRIFAAPGRMALTNYLMQTLFSVIVFYGVGFGLGIAAAPGTFVVIALLIFSLQVVMSNLWLKHYQYGPLEWLWRSLTYGEWLGIKLQDK